jgi:anhydro-N-acetylmuramic acid kinase
MLVAGIMSGTSLDGIDIALIEMPRFAILSYLTLPYPAKLRDAILAVSNQNCHTRDIARLHFELPRWYAKALGRLESTAKPDLIGCHGQTIYHEDGVCSLQIGDGSVLAELTGIPVVSDFRPRDIAAGGKGAPLAPYFDYQFFRHSRRGRIVLNLGGIGNLTAIPPRATPDQVIAFDTGPGNMVIDQIAARASNGRHAYDKAGKLAAQGEPDRAWIRQILARPYFRRKPPKTAGREDYGAAFVDELVATGGSWPDLAATATWLTAASVAYAVERFAMPLMPPGAPIDLIVSGGGARNPRILHALQALLPGLTHATSSDYGIPSDAKEAIFFAVLAYHAWKGRPNTIPTATGARHAVIAGKISR